MADRADWAHRKADEVLDEIDERLAKEYAETQAQADKELEEYLDQFEDERKQKRQELATAAFAIWAFGKILSGRKWAKARDKIANIYVNGNQRSASVINGYTNGVFKQNYDFLSFVMGRKLGDVSRFNPFNMDRLKELWKERELWRKANIYVPKDQRWHKQKIKSAVQKGIKNGESIDKITKRLQNVGISDEVAARRTARTAVTGAQNAGRLQSCRDAIKKGINVEKIWMATNDNRVRPSHRALDGEHVPVEEEFSNGLMYPGDANGAPEEYMNCRCRMDSLLVDIETGDEYDSADSYFDETDFDEWMEG